VGDDLHRDVHRFRTKLTRIRRKRGLSQRELGRQANVSFSTISRMEAGHDFSFDNAAKVAEALGYPLAEFLTAEPCEVCHGQPPKGFTCNSCGAFDDSQEAATVPPETPAKEET